MKKILLVIVTLFPILSQAYDVHVKGYTKSNGTYVQPHIRSSPDSTTANNYGNTRNTGVSGYGSSYGNGNTYGSGSGNSGGYGSQNSNLNSYGD